MNKVNSRKLADKLLKNLCLYESYAEYYACLEKNGSIPPRKAQEARLRAEHYRETARAARKALEHLNATKRSIIELLYFTPGMTVDDVCDKTALERSSVYRYRASALDKISAAT